MRFVLFIALSLPFASIAMETPVGSLGNAKGIFNALLDSGAEMKSSPAGNDTIDLIRAVNLVCSFESAPDLDARCTFFTMDSRGNPLKGIASSEDSWYIGFALISAGARKVHVSDTLSEVRLKSLVCNLRNHKSDSDCRFMQE